jgi:hypothetical protein
MSTKMSARGIVGSLRLLGVTAAVAVGMVGLGAAPASAATTAAPVAHFKLTDQQSALLAKVVSRITLPQITLKAKTCKQMDDANVNDDVLIKLGCIVIPVQGEILGGSIFG